MVLATHHRVPEVWASKHPVLALCYLSQYFPELAGRLLRRIGPARARALNDDAASKAPATDKGA